MTEWTEEDIDTLLKMHKRKFKQSEIAQKLGKFKRGKK